MTSTGGVPGEKKKKPHTGLYSLPNDFPLMLALPGDRVLDHFTQQAIGQMAVVDVVQPDLVSGKPRVLSRRAVDIQPFLRLEMHHVKNVKVFNVFVVSVSGEFVIRQFNDFLCGNGATTSELLNPCHYSLRQ